MFIIRNNFETLQIISVTTFSVFESTTAYAELVLKTTNILTYNGTLTLTLLLAIFTT